jgi:hypothetical protein
MKAEAQRLLASAATTDQSRGQTQLQAASQLLGLVSTMLQEEVQVRTQRLS